MTPWLLTAIQNGDVQDPSAPRRQTAEQILRDARQKHSDKKSSVAPATARKSTYRQVGLSRLQYGDGEYEAEVMAFQKFRECDLRAERVPGVCEVVPATRTVSRAVIGSRFSSTYGEDDDDDDDADDGCHGNGNGVHYGSEHEINNNNNNNNDSHCNDINQDLQGQRLARASRLRDAVFTNESTEREEPYRQYGWSSSGLGHNSPGRTFARLSSSPSSAANVRFRRFTSSQLPATASSPSEDQDDPATPALIRSSCSTTPNRQSTGYGNGGGVGRVGGGRGSVPGCYDTNSNPDAAQLHPARAFRPQSSAEALPQLVMSPQPPSTETPPESPMGPQRRVSSLQPQLMFIGPSGADDVSVASSRGSFSGGASGLIGETPLRRQVMRRSSAIWPVPQSPVQVLPSTPVGSLGEGSGGLSRANPMLNDLRKMHTTAGGRPDPGGSQSVTSPVAFSGNTGGVASAGSIREAQPQAGAAASSLSPGALRARSSSSVRLLQALSVLGGATSSGRSAGAGSEAADGGRPSSSIGSPQQDLTPIPSGATAAAATATAITLGLTVRVPPAAFTAPYGPAGCAADLPASPRYGSLGGATSSLRDSTDEDGGLFSPATMQLVASSPTLSHQLRASSSLQPSPSAATAAAAAAVAGSPGNTVGSSGGNLVGVFSISQTRGVPQPQPPSRPPGATLDGWSNRPSNRHDIRRMATTGSLALAAPAQQKRDEDAASPGRPGLRGSAGGAPAPKAPAPALEMGVVGEADGGIGAPLPRVWRGAWMAVGSTPPAPQLAWEQRPPAPPPPPSGPGAATGQPVNDMGNPAPLSPLPPSPKAPSGSVGRASIRLFGPRRAQSTNML